MNIGIEFKIPNEYGNYLKQILDDIEFTNYIWKITEDEVYVKENDANDGFLFPQEKEILDNIEFMKIISHDSYYTFFTNIQAYKEKNEMAINTYIDFLKSSCFLALFITDSIFVEIYAKDETILKTIYINAINSEFSDIRYIKENDTKRKIFSAYSD